MWAEALLEAVGFGERDPVAVANLGRQLTIGHRFAEHGHDALLQLARVLDIFLAVRGGDRRRRDHEDEGIRLLDRCADRLGKDLGVGDPFGIEPHLLALARDRLGEAVHERGVLAGIGDECISHASAPALPRALGPRALRASTPHQRLRRRT
jgi:hypothetical protein